MGRAIAPWAVEFDEGAPVGAELDAVLGERGRRRERLERNMIGGVG
jgi:hypothetical protein